MVNFPSEYKIALQSAIAACQEILEIYSKDFTTEYKNDGSPVTIADLNSSKIIQQFLEKTGIPIVGEEKINTAYSERKKWTKNWCVDPLDGTKEFVKRNGEFAVNIALIENHKPIFGVIAEPCKGRLIAGGKGLGVYLWDFITDPFQKNSQQIQASDKPDNTVVWIGSRSHPGADSNWEKQLLQNYNQVEKITKGSAIKFFDLAQDKAHVYPRFAPTMEWDIAAGQAILEELGGTVISIEDHLPLRYNKEVLFNPHFIAKTKGFLIQEKKFSTLRSI